METTFLDIDCVEAPSRCHVDHGVLIVEILHGSITSELVCDALQSEVLANLPRAETAVLFDCDHLGGRVTSQFLATLVAVRQRASKQGLLVCVCAMRGAVREVYDISCLGRIIPVYEDRQAALSAVGRFNTREIAGRTLLRERQQDEQVDEIRRQPWHQRIAALPLWKKDHRPVLVGVAMVALALIAIGVAWQLSFPANTPPRASRIDPETIPVSNVDGVQLNGEIRGPNGNEAGAWVIAWPMREPMPEPIEPSEVQQYFNAGAIGGFASPDIFATRALSDGKFQLPLGEPGAYCVLVMSSVNSDAGQLSAEDMRKINTRIQRASSLIGRRAYSVRYQPIVADRRLLITLDP